jgi:parallel beta-helix repeat protein
MKKIALALLLILTLLSSSYNVKAQSLDTTTVQSPVTSISAEPKTITVPDDYATIEDAVMNAIQGDTILVKKGTYHETLKIGKSVSLVGEDRDTTIIEGILRGGVKVPLTINQNNVSVTGFTLRDGYAGIQLHGNFNTISGNRITNTQWGIILSSGSHNNITANIVESIKYSGIKLAIATSNLIENNQVSANSGIEITQSSHYNTISENNIANNKEIGISLSRSDSNTLFGNNIKNSGIGAGIYIANNNSFYNNNFVDNTEQFSANEWYAMTFGYGGSTNTLNENFWSDYKSKYPNATEVDASGIGNTPYVINENNTDYRPLMRQVDISTTAPDVTRTSETENPSLTIAAITTVSAVVIGIVLLVYFKKRKH